MTTTRPKPHPRADATRERIVRAARKLFVKEGFSKISVEKIAKRAKINHSLIYHHFGGKDALWDAVKANIVAEAERKQALIPSTELPWPTFLRELMQRSIDFYRDNPDIVALINFQRMAGKAANQDIENISQSAQSWLVAIEHYQQQGDISSKYTSAEVSCFIFSLACAIAIDHQPVIPSTATQDDFIAHSCDILAKGLMR